MPTFGRGIQFMCFRSQIVAESERCLVESRFSIAFLSSLTDLAVEQKIEHVNAPIRCILVSGFLHLKLNFRHILSSKVRFSNHAPSAGSESEFDDANI